MDATRCPPSYKWRDNPHKWPYKWVAGVTTPISGVITLLITSRGPLCSRMHGLMPTRCKHLRTGPGGATWWATRGIEHLWLWEEFFLGVNKTREKENRRLRLEDIIRMMNPLATIGGDLRAKQSEK